MNGTVLSHHVLLDVSFRLAGQPDLSVGFVVDTGFVGELTLPVAAVEALGLPPVREIAANLADDSEIVVTVHRATVLWHGEARTVKVCRSDDRAPTTARCAASKSSKVRARTVCHGFRALEGIYFSIRYPISFSILATFIIL